MTEEKKENSAEAKSQVDTEAKAAATDERAGTDTSVDRSDTPASAEKDTYGYRGWLVSDYFWKRAFAAFGYVLAAQVVVYVFLYLLTVIFTGSIVSPWEMNMMMR
ncbi:MAG TPA: hypothetical protein ENJ77_01235 [Candidatus Moranbacteria bacterium]|nr:hypothetical protein [Candidatus Moranbacteria bacterium]